MKLLAWLGLADPCEMNDSSVHADTRRWLAADADARAEVSAREQLAAAQCREAAARYELRQRNRQYGQASRTIGLERMEKAFLRARVALLRSELDEWRRVHGTARPVDEQRAADEALVEAMQRHPSGTEVDPADTAKVGDPDPKWDDDGTCCKARHGSWCCTRSEGHRGQHVAGGGKVHAVWPNTDADAALVAKAEHLGDEIGREAAIEGAAITLRAHRLDPGGPRATCICGWGRGDSRAGSGLDELARHVAEQLAAVGALGNHTATPPDLIDKDGGRWRWLAGYVHGGYAPVGMRSRELVDASFGPVTEATEPEDVPW